MDCDYLGFFCLLGMITLFFIPVCADIPNRAPPETAVISTSTDIGCEGTVTQSNSLVWQQSSISLHNPPLDAGGFPWIWFDQYWNSVYGWTADPLIADLLGEPIPQGEVRYAAGYSATAMAVQGTMQLTRMVDVDTDNAVGNEHNIDVTTHLAFFSTTNVGRATSDEDLLIDAAGGHTTGMSSALCPFAGDDCPFNPPFCNVVQMGSWVEVSQGSISTLASGRFVAESDTLPVTMDYSINGRGNSPYDYAIGSMSVSMDAHLQEGRMMNITPYNPEAMDQPAGFVPIEAADITYSESTYASGAIGRFTKNMHYQSGRN